MTSHLTLSSVCVPAKGVVSREAEGEVVVLAPVVGIGDGVEDLFTLNGTGRIVWRALDGTATLGTVAAALAGQSGISLAEAEADVLGFARALMERGILRESA